MSISRSKNILTPFQPFTETIDCGWKTKNQAYEYSGHSVSNAYYALFERFLSSNLTMEP